MGMGKDHSEVIRIEIHNHDEENETSEVLDEKEALDSNRRKDSISSSSSSSSSSSDEEVPANQDEEDFGDVIIPFNNIHNIHDEPEEKREYFLPCVPVRVKITERIYQSASHRLNPNLYIVGITHGKYKWIIKRRDNHFRELYRHLEVYHASFIMKHPKMALRVEKVPRCHQRPDITCLSEKSKDKHMRNLQKFLQNVLNCDRYRNNKHTLDFMEVCFLSFVDGLGQKEKETEVLKRAGGHTFSKGLLRNLKINIAWHERWLVVKSTFVAYIDKEKNIIRDVLLFDKDFTVSCEKAVTGIKNGVLISNSSRNLLVKGSSNRQARELMRILVNTMSEKGINFIGEHRFNSFAPERRKCWTKWYVDGSDYFSEVANAISSATEEIFITDWWLSPELMLQRSAENLHKSRLDLLLKERADNGIKIYVILYKELELALAFNSAYTKRTLLNLHHANIKVLRHPDHVAGNAVLLWAHHEKIVCIDQKLCFLGGLDLCYGRWDDNRHVLTDFGSATPSFFRKTDSAVVNFAGLMVNHDAINSAYHRKQLQTLTRGEKVFIGKDYFNPFVMDIKEVDKPLTDLIDRNTTPRMPWHDIGCLVFGNPAKDLARHFIQRWNYTKQQKAKEMLDIPYLLPKINLEKEEVPDGFNDVYECDVQILRSSSSWSTGVKNPECSIYEAYLEHIRNAKYYIYIENQFFITSNDEHCVSNGIGDALIERILTAYNNDETFRVYVVMPLLPCFPGEIGTGAATSTVFVEFWNLQSSRYIITRLKKAGIDDPSDYISFHGLRNYADLRGSMVSEIVYVHSKLMIIDDLVSIIGSANINDRSMLGNRDSEIAICVQDTKFIHGVMNGKQAEVGQYTARLRRKLFQEHLGLLNEPYANVIDPVSDHFYKDVWIATARSNTDIYEQVFRCLPTNEVHTYAELHTYKKSDGLKETDPVQARSLLKEIHGYVVMKPLEFLQGENLWPSADNRESLVPTKVFT